MTERFVVEFDRQQSDILEELVKAAIVTVGWDADLLKTILKSLEKEVPVTHSTYQFRALEIGDDFSAEVNRVHGWGQIKMTSDGRTLIHLSAGGEETVLRLYTASQIYLCERVFGQEPEDAGTTSG